MLGVPLQAHDDFLQHLIAVAWEYASSSTLRLVLAQARQLDPRPPVRLILNNSANKTVAVTSLKCYPACACQIQLVSEVDHPGSLSSMLKYHSCYYKRSGAYAEFLPCPLYVFVLVHLSASEGCKSNPNQIINQDMKETNLSISPVIVTWPLDNATCIV